MDELKYLGLYIVLEIFLTDFLVKNSKNCFSFKLKKGHFEKRGFWSKKGHFEKRGFWSKKAILKNGVFGPKK
jgi:hypothetical protein